MGCGLNAAATDSSLIERVRSQDQQAWREFVDLYAPSVFAWARQFGLKDADAADVTQETLLAVHRYIADFRRQNPQDSFRGWLWTITSNKVRDHFRRLASQPEAAGGTDAIAKLQQFPDLFADASSAPRDVSLSSDLMRRALDLIRGEFEPHTWQAFWRSAVDGESTAEIARDLNMQKPAVRQAKYRILRRLRKELC
jgi:RNA polymerase sigma-70 factor (ECF subfamily)